MTRIHSTLHVFSKIGLVMLFCRSVLVRDGLCSFQNLPFNSPLSKIQEPVRASDESMCRILLSSKSKHFFKEKLLFFIYRFAETEGTAVLAMLVSQYKITIKEEPQFASETFEERKSRILSASQGLTLMYVSK